MKLRYILPFCLTLACTDAPVENKDMTARMDMPRDTSKPQDMTRDTSSEDMTPPKDQSDTSKDMAPDANRDMSTDTSQDMSTDTTPDMPAADMTSDMPADMATDMPADMSPPDYSGRPSGMCTSTASCGGSLTCTRSAAGGVCQGCIADNDCNTIQGSGTYTCLFGACVRECSTTDDCAPGRKCTSQGRCALQRCSNSVCPTPMFVCDGPNGICQRASCAAGQTCPTGTTCTDNLCVENHSLP